MTRKIRASVAFLALLLSAPIVWAHHSFTTEFDPDLPGTLEGVVTEVGWANPHVRYHIDVESESGEVQSWELQTRPTNMLVRRNWLQDSIEVGDRITACGSLGRDGRPMLYIDYVLTAGGGRLNSAVNDDSRPTREEADARRYGSIPSIHPIDITGTWRNNYHWVATVDDFEPKPTPFTEEAREVFENLQFGDDPALRCAVLGLARLFGAPNPMEIVEVGPYYLISSEVSAGNSVRRIFMDGRELPNNIRPSMNGYSVGRWDEGSLIIETTHLIPGWLDGSGLAYTGDPTRIVETWTPSDDNLTMERTMVIHDPLYTEPLIRRRGSARADLDVVERVCDPDGFYRDLRDEGLLDSYFENERL